MRYGPKTDMVCGDIEGELVALHIPSGRYLHLNGSAGAIYTLLQEHGPLTAEAICEHLRARYAVDAQTCAREVADFLQAGVQLELLEPHAASA